MARNFAAKAVHKYMYPGTYNFRDEVDGTKDSDIDFIDTDSSGADCEFEIVSSWQGHNKVLRMSDQNGATQCDVKHTIDSPQTNGTIEWFFGSTDTALYTQCTFMETGTRGPRIYFDTDLIKYYDGAFHNIVAAADNTFYHMRMDFECGAGVYKGLLADTFFITVNGTRYGPYAFHNAIAEINQINLVSHGVSTGYYSYYDAFGFSWDTDYAIGDNVFWRHYGESTDSFESDDVGTQGTSITWVDGVDNADDSELVQEFNEHKKILRTYMNSGAGYSRHNFPTVGLNGWVSTWVKVVDAAVDNTFLQLREAASVRINVAIQADLFKYRNRATAWVTAGVAAADNTWYHVYLQWYSDSTFDLWVDNVQYLDGVQTYTAFTGTGISRWYVDQNNAGANYIYINAPISSLDSDVRADNRIFDYNDAYTREDITTATQNVIYTNVLHGWRTATLYSKTDYDHDRVFLQIYDINSILALEAEIINRVQKSEIRTYTLLDKNYDDLKSLSSNTFSADDLHDPTDSTCMLKTVLPNVSEIDGDLILVNADTKTDTYSTVTKNYPDGDFLRDISDLSDSCVIIEANGKCHLDDDLASGDSLDFDNAADHSKMTGEPKVNDILDTINYFEIFGAINPDTGERFYKITDNSGDDRKRKWRITNNSFRNQTDLDAYAAKLVAKLVSVNEITIKVQGLGAHNMGTLFTYKYDNDIYTIPSAAYYVISESIDFDTAAATILLSEGIIEGSKYAAGFERPQNYNDTLATEIYETDLITFHPETHAVTGATKTSPYIILNAVGEAVGCNFYIPANCDDGREMYIDVIAQRADANADVITMDKYLYGLVMEGGANAIWDTVATTWDGTVQFGYAVKRFTVDASDITANTMYFFKLIDNEAGDIIYVQDIAITYYIKRVLS